jgi:hypothetical protein
MYEVRGLHHDALKRNYLVSCGTNAPQCSAALRLQSTRQAESSGSGELRAAKTGALAETRTFISSNFWSKA